MLKIYRGLLCTVQLARLSVKVNLIATIFTFLQFNAKSIKEQLFSHHVQIYESNLAQMRDTNEKKHSIDKAQVKVLYSLVCELERN